MRHLMLAAALLVPTTIFGQHHHPFTGTKPATLMAGMGDVHHPISTANKEAQRFFDQGLAFFYGFNHDEALGSFKRAAELNPQLVMAHRGIALALGSNYNLQADARQQRAA